MTTKDIGFLSELETIVHERLENPTENSYTATLSAGGVKRIAQKVGEEGVELALAAVAGDRNEIIDETADLLYHVIVLLACQNVSLEDIAAQLKVRHRRSK